MKSLRNLSSFYASSFVFLIVCIIVLASTDKVQLHLTINKFHNSFFDLFFEFWTVVADGLFVAIAGFILLFFIPKQKRLSAFILTLLTLLLTGILAQTGKQLIYPDATRPLEFIKDHTLYLVEGIDIHRNNSFPSGHTTAAFGFFSLVAYLFFKKNRKIQILLALFAMLCAYSRMYLSQHFLEDVTAGTVLGLLSFIIAYAITSKIKFKNSIIE